MKVPGGKATRIGAILAAIGIAVASTVAAIPWDDDVTVTAVFTDASPLVPGNEIKASGATVGLIESIELVDGRAQVRMSVERSVLPIHTDATATITEKDLLGERYIALEPGSPSKPLLGDDEIVLPESQTDRSVDLQDVLNAQDDPTSTALAAMVTALGEGVDGRGKDIAAGIKAFAPALRQADQLARILSDHNELLTRLIDSTQPVLGALTADRGTKLDNMVGSTERILSAVAANQRATEAALDRLPKTLAGAQRTLAQVAGVSEAMTPTLAGMRPVTDDLSAISGELQRFADAADPALASMGPVLERADRMLDEAAPVVGALRAAGPDMRSLSKSGRKIMADALSGRLTNLMKFLKNWALITSGYDGVSHYFRAAMVNTAKPLATSALGPVPGAPDAQKLPNLPYPNTPNLDKRPQPEVKPLPKLDPGGSATGLSQKQENSMLSQLLGGT